MSNGTGKDPTVHDFSYNLNSHHKRSQFWTEGLIFSVDLVIFSVTEHPVPLTD